MPDQRCQNVAIVGSYPPRKCGIATFTKDLHDALIADKDSPVCTSVLAMDDEQDGYDYPPEVRFEIHANKPRHYELATDFLNISPIDIVLLQHEYGLFGARAGENIVSLVRDTRVPVITTLHTVLDNPTWEQSSVMRELLQHSDRVVVMSNRARVILRDLYGADESKVAIIPHGIPDLPFVDPSYYKDRFGLSGKRVLMTFGLLGPGKGIETAIDALPEIVARRPDVVYVIVGALHPHVERRQGRSYIHGLQRQAERLGVSENVIFHNRYVSLEELSAYLGAADIYVTPYPGINQICSGTLTYAMGAGKAVVSTPFYYAQEMLAENRGRFFDFSNAQHLSEVVLEILDNPVETDAMRKAAYTYCRDSVWSKVGAAYRKLCAEVQAERHVSPRRIVAPTLFARRAANLPEIRLNHLAALTDDTGILQHAVYSLPDRHHGYCTDDNARALLATMMHWELVEDESVLALARRYMSFLFHAYRADKHRFTNFMRYDRQWTAPADFSDDAFGRTLLALSNVISLAPSDDLRIPAARLFGEALPGADTMTSPRGWALTLLAIRTYLRRYSGDSFARRTRDALAHKLHQAFAENATPAWPWCEQTLTYENAVLPHALISAGVSLSNPAMTQRGLDVLQWLFDCQTADRRLSLIGNQSWYPRGGVPATFDQQPIDAMALACAAAEALRATRDEKWFAHAHTAFDWFLGVNCVQAELYDPATGGCRDGLTANGANANQGAESTLAWLISLMTMHKLQRQRTLSPEPAAAPAEDQSVAQTS